MTQHTHQHDHSSPSTHAHEHGDCGCHGGHCHCHHDHGHDHGESAWYVTYRAEIFSGLLMVAAIVLSHSGVFARMTAMSGAAFDWVSLIVFIIAILPVGLPVVREMFESWVHGSVMNEFTLMVAASIGAFAIGEYPEAVAVLLFYSLGEKLEGSASDDVKRRIKALLGRLPDQATVIVDGKEHRMNPRDVKTGSRIRVRPGEKVPVDGMLLGDAPMDFDTSAITGESVPRSYKPGEEISSGMIPVDHAIEVRTVRPFSESSMSRILKMIEDAQASKSPTENMLRRITRWYTPVVFTMAIMLVAVPWIVSLCGGPEFELAQWFRRSLVFLVCSCPCALVVSIPLSYFASLGAASKKGLLFKGSKYVDAMRDIDTVVFDKTGTLTTGEFHISGIDPVQGTSSDEVLAIAASIDAESTHPLAIAICKEAAKRNLHLPEVADVTTVAHGMTASVGNHKVAVGSPSLMKRLGVILPERNGEGSEICVSRNGRYLGSIYLLDTIKPEAAKAIKNLHALGVKKIEILSGDRKEAVELVAKQLGADSFRASLLPADKQDAIKALRQNGKVAFVGDGINDAPAIAASDVGVAMGTMGTDIAMQSADVVIAGDNLEKLPDAIRLARKVRNVVVTNVSFALGVKAVVMGLGAFGIASLWAAVFADTGVTLITILWTLLALRK